MFVESRKKRRRRKRLTTLGICLIVLGMAMYGYNTSREEVRQQQQQAESQNTQTPIQTLITPNIPVVKPQDPVIEKHAEVILVSHYLGCGHEIESTLDSNSFVGLTQKQLQALYPQYTITSFASTRVEMRRDVEGVCPRHYMVKLEDSVLVIYQRDDNDSWRKVQTIEDFYMPYEDETLKEGVIFDDMHQIESFLENLDS